MLAKLPSATSSVTKHSKVSSHSSYARPAASRPERSVRLMHVSSGGTNTSAIRNRWGGTIDTVSKKTTTKYNPRTKHTTAIQRHASHSSALDPTLKQPRQARARSSKHNVKCTFKRVSTARGKAIGKDAVQAASKSDALGMCGQCHAPMPITYSFCTKCGSALPWKQL